MIFQKYLIIIALTTCAVIQTSSIQAEEAIDENNLSQTSQPNTVSTERTAHIDPNTGKLTSTPDETNSKLPATNIAQGSLPAVEMLHHSNGTVQAKLNGRFRSQLVAQISCDGKIIMTHSESKTIETINCGDSE